MSSDGQLTDIKIAPGIYKNSTELGSEGRWIDADKVRFHYGNPQKMGGWVPETVRQADVTASTTFTGIPRDILIWQNNAGDADYIAVGTHRKLEVFKSGQIYDITPIEAITTLTSNIHTTNGSTLVTVSAVAHDAQVNDFVVLGSMASSIGGLTLSGQYVVASILSTDKFTIDTATTATATSAGSGTVSYLLGGGSESNRSLQGWSRSTYGSGGWGSSVSASGLGAKLRQWSMVNWGEDLMACPRGGRIYVWDQSNGVESALTNRSDVRATLVTASPSVNNFIMISQTTRYLISFGCNQISGPYDPLLVRWSNQENYNVWDPTVSVAGGNTSGEQRVRGGNMIVGAVQSRGEIIIFTDDPVHVMRYTGDPLIFGFDEIGSNAGLISQHAAVDINGTVFWMGLGDFHMYDGRLRTLPCEVHEAIFAAGNGTSINYNQKEKIFCAVNAEFSEVIWFYPSENSEECDRYVIYNYLENIWYDGTMDRTVWCDSGIFETPYAINSSGTLYSHEVGVDDGAQAMPFYLESGYTDLQDGQDFVFVDKLSPDFKNLPNGKTINFKITTKKYPQDANPVVKGPFPITNTTKKVSFRARGRQAKIRFESSGNGVDFTLGTVRLNIKPDGER